MKATYIDYKETCSFSPAVIRYIENDPQLQSFISQWPTDYGFQQIISKRKVLADRQILVEVLTEQYAQIDGDLNLNVAASIEKLASQNTFTVTTGHQLNIFTGPLYFIYKIATALKLAAELKEKFPDKDFVPVYWMATEDHDFAEINHTSISGKRITWNEETTGATGRLDPRGISKALAEYKAILGLGQGAEQLAAIVDQAYRSHKSLALATRFLVNALFGEYGLVIVDGDHPALKKQFAKIISEDILHESSFKNIQATIGRLEDAGVEAQVNPREINFFYLKDQLRERLVHENGRYYVLNSELSFSAEQLQEEISQYPERFSPNVVMRPLYQEVILPNIAYIGGGAEIVYWLQLKNNFEHYSVDFPILILRNSALIGDNLEHRLSKLNLTYPDLFQDPELVKKKWVLKYSENDLQLRREWQELDQVFVKLKEKAGKIDKSLQPSTEAIQSRLKKALENLEKKLIRAEKRNHAASLRHIDAMREKFFPKGSLQERSENFGLLYAKHGKNFIDCLIAAFHPLDFKFTIIEFDE